MANTLTDRQKTSLCDILDMDIVTVTEHLTYIDDRITAALDERLKAEIAYWDTNIKDDFLRVHPNTENMGADINPEREKSAVRQRIGRWLMIPAASLKKGNRLVRG